MKWAVSGSPWVRLGIVAWLSEDWDLPMFWHRWHCMRLFPPPFPSGWMCSWRTCALKWFNLLRMAALMWQSPLVCVLSAFLRSLYRTHLNSLWPWSKCVRWFFFFFALHAMWGFTSVYQRCGEDVWGGGLTQSQLHGSLPVWFIIKDSCFAVSDKGIFQKKMKTFVDRSSPGPFIFASRFENFQILDLDLDPCQSPVPYIYIFAFLPRWPLGCSSTTSAFSPCG